MSTKLPKVLLLTDSDVFAGTERHMLDLAVALRDLDIEVAIGCPTPAPLADRATAEGLRVISVPKCGTIDRPAIRQVKQLLRAQEIDLVHAHNGRTHLVAAAAVSGAGRGVCIATQHFLHPTRTGRRGIKAVISNILHRWVMKRTASIIAISDAVRREAVARHDAPPGSIHTVLNGITKPAVNLLPTPAEVRRTLQTQSGIPVIAPLIVCAARLQREKDIPVLITAMKKILLKVPTAYCIIAGTGDDQASLQAEIDAHGLHDRMQLLGFRNDVLALINAADVFVLPSAAEPFGLVIVEAMALQKPVVAARAGGPPEIIAHGETGLLVNPADAEGMAGALAALLLDPDLRTRYGQAGFARFRTHFTAHRMAKEMLDVYYTALGRSSSKSLSAKTIVSQ